MSGWIKAIAAGASWLAVTAMGVSLFVLLIRYFSEPAAPGIRFGPLIRRLMDGRPLAADSIGEASTANRQLRRRLRRNEWALHTQLQLIAWILCVVIMSRLVIMASALIGSWLGGDLLAFFNDFEGHWIRWDAKGYLALAKYGYTAETREYLVLMPMYPLLVRLTSVLFFGKTALAGLVVSNLALGGAGWALYLLVQEKYGQISARRAVQLLMFCPLSVFFSVPYAESLFLFLTLLSILLARRQKFIAAVAVGMLAAFTRLAGILTVIPVFLEILKYEYSIHLWPRHKGRCIGRLVFYTLMTAMIGLGFVGYMGINYAAAGDPFAFITVQSEVWSQTFGSMGNTLRYSIESAFTDESGAWKLGVWIPQSLGMVLVTALLLVMSLRMDPGDGLYAWMYMVITLASTWLLTGPRMLVCMYPLYCMLVQATRRKGLYGGILLGSLILMIGCSYLYAVVGTVL